MPKLAFQQIPFERLEKVYSIQNGAGTNINKKAFTFKFQTI